MRIVSFHDDVVGEGPPPPPHLLPQLVEGRGKRAPGVFYIRPVSRIYRENDEHQLIPVLLEFHPGVDASEVLLGVEIAAWALVAP